MEKVERLNHIKSLDGLRGIAALMIVAAHSPELKIPVIGPILKAIPSLLQFGYISVDIFFILSGFLITRILISEKAANQLSIENFFIKRSLRILPIYYAVILFTSITYGFNSDSIAAITYSSNYYFSFNMESSPLRHTWYLSVDQQFYIIWPFLIKKISGHKNLLNLCYLFIIISIISTISTAFIFEAKFAEIFIYRGTQYRIISLIFGSLLAINSTKEAYFKLLSRRKLLIFFTSGVLLVLSGILSRKVFHLDSLYPIFNTFGFSIASMSIVVFIIYIDENKLYSKFNFLKSSFLIYFGKISYGLYLIHFVVFYTMGISHGEVINPVQIEYYLKAIIITLFLSHFSYYLFEVPVMSLKKYFIRSA